MSFDVYVADQWVANYTSNMGAFFAWALDGTESENPQARCDSRDAIFGKAWDDGLNALHNLPAEQARERLRAALVRIAGTPSSELVRFNAENGWGKVETATEFLRKFFDACCSAPEGAEVQVSG